VGAALLTPRFYVPSNLINVLQQAAALGIVSLGQTFVILVAGIDLSVGSIMGLCMVVAAAITGGANTLVVPAIAAALALGGAIGLANGLLVTVRNVPPFVATLGMLVFIDGVRVAYTKGVPSGGIPPFLVTLGTGALGPLPIAVLIWLALSAFGLLVLHRTPFGQQVYATGGNPIAARLSGVPVGRVVTLAFIISGVLASAAGLLLSGFIGYVDRYIGTGFDLNSIAAVVIGGTSFAGGRGGVSGTIAGVLLMTALGNIVLLAGLSQPYQLVVNGVAIVAAVALYSVARRGD
jgi:ribose/xylose/arabinose/galactoside ABC-type transport system permease subunit